MKMVVTCTSIVGLLMVLILGCEGTESPIYTETPNSPTNPLVPIDARILGSWFIEEVIWFKEGVQTYRIDSRSIGYGPFVLTSTFMPDGLFHATSKSPIEKVTTLSWD